jgi:HlyD family secretion protein
MRFSALNRTAPEIEGDVVLVSADLTQDQRTGTSHYTARVSLKPDQVERLAGAKLVPGMPVDVFIQTPSRTVLTYLIEPLKEQAERAFKER